MRIEVNLETGETTEHEDAPVTWEVPVEVVTPEPTKNELLAELELLTAKINALAVTPEPVVAPTEGVTPEPVVEPVVAPTEGVTA